MTKPALKALLLMGTVLLASLSSPLVMGKGVYQSGPDFIADTFGRGADTAPKAKSLWLTAPIRQRAAQIVGRPIAGLRIRYHQRASKTAWILEEIGKEMPITIGIVVQDNKIERVKILAYRESRGGEVRYPAYTQQYVGAALSENNKLNQSIDGITGATLSMWAVNKVAALALYYHSHTQQPVSDL
ncbi:FMN-binding protein [Porticoccaceae bacterium]|nr:FMN-binding protein [Porticoccaceae bacterium]MDC0133632.1 FMN-binding protein [Porticoccaceae bacterium]MDC1477520.1 FMN-binding protein [Porticoccaceae bacterium]|tara:strand:- start:881 stop:1438 length:558 start_codon:yes stop_codon:yes gene_type:complete